MITICTSGCIIQIYTHIHTVTVYTVLKHTYSTSHNITTKTKHGPPLWRLEAKCFPGPGSSKSGRVPTGPGTVALWASEASLRGSDWTGPSGFSTRGARSSFFPVEKKMTDSLWGSWRKGPRPAPPFSCSCSCSCSCSASAARGPPSAPRLPPFLSAHRSDQE